MSADEVVTRRALTPAELRAGMRRLALVALALVGAVLLLAAGFALLGAGGRGALSAGSGVVGVLLVMAGVVAFTRTSSVRRTRGSIGLTTAEERRQAELLALGLFGFGITFSAISLAIG